MFDVHTLLVREIFVAACWLAGQCGADKHRKYVENLPKNIYQSTSAAASLEPFNDDTTMPIRNQQGLAYGSSAIVFGSRITSVQEKDDDSTGDQAVSSNKLAV